MATEQHGKDPIAFKFRILAYLNIHMESCVKPHTGEIIFAHTHPGPLLFISYISDFIHVENTKVKAP